MSKMIRFEVPGAQLTAADQLCIYRLDVMFQEFEDRSGIAIPTSTNDKLALIASVLNGAELGEEYSQIQVYNLVTKYGFSHEEYRVLTEWFGEQKLAEAIAATW